VYITDNDFKTDKTEITSKKIDKTDITSDNFKTKKELEKEKFLAKQRALIARLRQK
jgi:hypothetical protein